MIPSNFTSSNAITKGGPNGASWPNATSSMVLGGGGSSSMIDNTMGMDRMPSPPAASPPSLSSTDRRQLVSMDHYPGSIPRSMPNASSPNSPTATRRNSGGGGGSNGMGASLADTLSALGASAAVGSAGGDPSSSMKKIRVHRSTYVPGWAVPPRVLLVEDDLVSRRLSSKFLQVSGCTIDVAVDGVGAVNKMELEKYDLVLMVRDKGIVI